MFGRAVSVSEDVVFLGEHSLGAGYNFACHRLQTMRLPPGVNGAFTHVNCFVAANEILMLVVTGQVPY